MSGCAPREEGFALLHVLWVVVILSILSFGLMLLVQAPYRAVNTALRQSGDQYLAEAALAKWPQRFRQNPAADPLGSYSVTVLGQTVELQVSDDAGTVNVNRADDDLISKVVQALAASTSAGIPADGPEQKRLTWLPLTPGTQAGKILNLDGRIYLRNLGALKAYWPLDQKTEMAFSVASHQSEPVLAYAPELLLTALDQERPSINPGQHSGAASRVLRVRITAKSGTDRVFILRGNVNAQNDQIKILDAF